MTADPQITASTGSPSRSASARRFRTTKPQPSPRTYPSAAASKVLQRPAGDIIPDLEKAIGGNGESIRFTPPASARLDSPRCKLSHARCTATSEDEHAVSTHRLGPWQRRKCESRPATLLAAKPMPL